MEKNLGEVRSIFTLQPTPLLLQGATLFEQDRILEIPFEVGETSECFSVPYQSLTRHTNDI